MAAGTDQALGPHNRLDMTPESPMVLLTGASSQIGVFAIPRLLAAGFRVLAVNRKGKPPTYPEYAQVTWLNEVDALEASACCQYLLSAGPLELARRFLTTRRNGFSADLSRGPFSSPEEVGDKPNQGEPYQSAVIFSSSSVETKQESANQAERSQVQDMLTLESELQSLAQTMDIKLVIFRPTLIYGCGLDTNVTRLAKWISRFGFMPLNGQAKGLRQPVHADDLASIAVSALLSHEALPPVLTLCGGETLSYLDMVTRIFETLDKRARLLHLPQWLFVALVRLANFLQFSGGINIEMVRRQAIDLVFDDQLARQLLDYAPRKFTLKTEDLSLPVQVSEYSQS